MDGFARDRREQRLQQVYDETELLTPQRYNLILCGTVLWGMVINFILCLTIGNVFRYIDPLLFYVGYFACCIVGILMSAKSKNPTVSFIGYNLIVVPIGLVISTSVEVYGGIGSEVVTGAFLITMCVTAAMTAFSFYKPEMCRRFGPILFPCLCGLIVAEIIMLIFNINSGILSWVSAVLFSLYIAYDVYRSQQFAYTVDNAADCAVDIYLDIANLFLDILRILGSSKRRK